MISITVKYFASIREAFGKADETLNVEQGATVGDIWQKVIASVPADRMSGKVLCALNQRYVDSNALVNDGDEVAFFPPVTGG